MRRMFDGCNAIRVLDVSNFNNLGWESKISLKKRLFQNTNEVKIDRKNYPKDTIKEEKINIKNSPVIKKLRNLSLDGYNISISPI